MNKNLILRSNASLLIVCAFCTLLMMGCSHYEVRSQAVSVTDDVVVRESPQARPKSKIPTLGISISCSSLFSDENDCIFSFLRIFKTSSNTDFSDSLTEQDKKNKSVK